MAMPELLSVGTASSRTEEEEPITLALPSEVKTSLFLRAILAGRCERVHELLRVSVDPNTKFLTRILFKEPSIPETLTAAFTAKDEDTSFVTALTLAMTLLFQEIRLCLPTLAATSNMIQAYEHQPNEPPVSELDTYGWPRVRCAQVLAPQWAVFVLLLRAGADPNALSFDAKPPLIWALSTPACLYPVMRHLFHAGADIHDTGPFHASFIFERLLTPPRWYKDSEILRLIIQHGAVLTSDCMPPYHRILMRSVKHADTLAALELFLEAGYDVDQVWSNESALTLAIKKMNTEMVVWLIRQGAVCHYGGKSAMAQAAISFPELIPVLSKMEGSAAEGLSLSSVAKHLQLVKLT